LGNDKDVGVDLRVERSNAFQHGLGEFNGRELSAFDQISSFGQR
jgi:hypothetical protein